MSKWKRPPRGPRLPLECVGEIRCSTSWGKLRHDLRRAAKDRSGVLLDAAEIVDCTVSCHWPTLGALAYVELPFLFWPARTKNKDFEAGIASRMWKSRPTRYLRYRKQQSTCSHCDQISHVQGTSPHNPPRRKPLLGSPTNFPNSRPNKPHSHQHPQLPSGSVVPDISATELESVLALQEKKLRR